MKKIAFLLILIMMVEMLLASCSPIVPNDVENNNDSADIGTNTEGDEEADHEHDFAEALTYDKIYHFYLCECGEKNSASFHDFGEWMTLTESTDTSDGQKRRDCKVCDYIEIATIPGGTHQHSVSYIEYDESTHTGICSCGKTVEINLHILSDWKVTETATENASGMKMRECSVCEYDEFVSIPKIQKGETVFEWRNLTIENLGTGQYLNNDFGKLVNGNPLRIWPWDGSAEQRFDIINVSGNTYRIVTNASGSYAVDVFRDGKALAEGMLCDIWKTGDDATAQNLKLHLCSDGSYIFRMAKNMDLAIGANGSKNQLKLVKFDESDKNQKWIFRNAEKEKVDVKDPMPTSVGIPEDAYVKTGVVFSISGNTYYQAKTTKAYHGVDSDSHFYINSAGKVVTSSDLINKLYRLEAFESIRKSQLDIAKNYALYAEEYYEIYCNIQATEKLGEIIGTGSGVLLQLGAGSPCALGDAAVEIIGDVDASAIKNIVLLSYLKIYTNNCEAYADQMVKYASEPYYDYDNAMKAINAYISCVSSWAVIDEIAGDGVRELSQSSTAKELGKYFKNVFTSLADTIIPDIPSVKIAKYISDGCITLADFYADSGVMKAYEGSENTWLPIVNRNYENAKIVADKLAVSEGVEGTKYVAAGLVELLDNVKAKYPEGSNVSHSYVFPKTSAYECHGFACYTLMQFWGTKKPGVSNTSEYNVYKATSSESYVNKIRPGDLVRFRLGSYDHTIVVTNVDEDNIYYADCNADLKCTFDYNKVMSKTTLAKHLVKTLYSQQVSTRGYILHAKNNSL